MLQVIQSKALPDSKLCTFDYGAAMTVGSASLAGKYGAWLWTAFALSFGSKVLPANMSWCTCVQLQAALLHTTSYCMYMYKTSYICARPHHVTLTVSCNNLLRCKYFKRCITCNPRLSQSYNDCLQNQKVWGLVKAQTHLDHDFITIKIR